MKPLPALNCFVALPALVLACVAGCSATHDPIALHERAVAQYRTGNYVSAIGLYKWALEKDPEQSLSMVGLAACYKALAQQQMHQNNYPAALRDLDEALFWLNQATMTAPGDYRATRLKMDCLDLRGQAEKSLKTAQWTVRYVGPSAESLLLLARSYRDLGDYDNAELAYKQAIAVAPNEPRCHLQAARFYKFLGKHQQALQHLQQALALGPDDPSIVAQIEQLERQLAKPEPMTTEPAEDLDGADRFQPEEIDNE